MVEDGDRVVEACEAAVRGGLHVLEITLTTPDALEAIEELSRLSYGLTEKLYAALGGMEDDFGDDVGAEAPEDEGDAEQEEET